MTVLDTRSVRAQWRDVVDQVVAGSDVIVTRAGKPTVAVISYADYERIQDELADLRSAQMAAVLLAQLDAGKITASPLTEVKQRLAELDR
ncbi:MAG: type II toxin-antitoxin system Phd/YefM family antitoxin, partial [Steroidobacteraceae bacterium]